jgi:hypothetical protein
LIQSICGPKERILSTRTLAFSGGQFQGRYILRIAASTFSDIDYDTSLEFDDEGRPMMGRAQLVDKDAILQDEMSSSSDPPL